MTKLKKILLVVLAIGFITTGIGIARMLLEAADFSFGKTVVLNSDSFKEGTVTFDISGKEYDRINVAPYPREGTLNKEKYVVEAAEDIPEDKIEVTYTYNDLALDFQESGSIYTYDDADDNKVMVLDGNFTGSSSYGFEAFLDGYKMFLQDLKNKVLNTYTISSIEKCVIRVNPEIKDKINV